MRDLAAARSPPLIAVGAAVHVLPPAMRYVLRGTEGVRTRVQAVLGFEVPSRACRAGANGERAALWLGPDEWLLLAPESEATSFGASLEAALATLPCSLVDVSHRQVGLAVSGPAAETLLAAGCPLDLDARTFSPGMCTRTMLAKAEIVLWRTDERTFRLEVWRSFARYVAAFLAEAERGII